PSRRSRETALDRHRSPREGRATRRPAARARRRRLRDSGGRASPRRRHGELGGDRRAATDGDQGRAERNGSEAVRREPERARGRDDEEQADASEPGRRRRPETPAYDRGSAEDRIDDVRDQPRIRHALGREVRPVRDRHYEQDDRDERERRQENARVVGAADERREGEPDRSGEIEGRDEAVVERRRDERK